MALQLNFTTEHGIELPEAYLRIDYISIKKNKAEISFGIYKDFENSDKTPIHIGNEYFNIDISTGSKNYHQQSYDLLKSLDKFKDSIDV